MSLLQIVQDAADELGLPRPETVVSNDDNTVRALLRMANKEGIALARHESSWGVLQREHTFTTVSGQPEYDLPTDFYRFIDNTIWDRSNYWEMRGPLSPQEWQLVKSGLVQTSAPRRRWRAKRSSSELSRKFFVDPTPGEAETLVFEYVSTNWCRNADNNTAYARWQADDNEPMLDGEVMTMGVVWRWLAARGLEYAIQLAEYESARDKEIASDDGLKLLSVTGARVSPDGLPPEAGIG